MARRAKSYPGETSRTARAARAMASCAPLRRLIAAVEAKIRADNTERIAYGQEMAVIRELEQRFAIRHYGRAVPGDRVERLIRHLHEGVLITDRTWQEMKEIDAEAAERKGGMPMT